MTDALLFGGIDNLVLLVGALFGLEVEALLSERARAWMASALGARGLGAVVGAGLGNAFSDFLGGLPIGLTFASGAGLGCLLALLALPALVAIQRRLTKEI